MFLSKMFYSFVFISFVLIASGTGTMVINASPAELVDSLESIELNNYIEILEDPNKEWDIHEVTTGEAATQFEKNDGGVPSYGYTDAAYWVRFQVMNSSDRVDWFLELENPTMDVVTLYELSSNEEVVAIRETGDHFPFAEREVDHRYFIFSLENNLDEVQTYYLRFETEGAMQLPLTLRTQESLMMTTQIDYGILGLLCGLALVMAIYNLFVYLSLRHRSYLYYVGFIFVNLLTYLSFTGLAYQFFWPEAVWWNNRSIVFFMGVSNILALLFTSSFLGIKQQFPRVAKWLFSLIGINIFVIILLFFSYSAALDFIVVATGVSVLFIISTAFISLRRGFRPARFFFLAWHIFIVGVLVSILTDMGMIPLTFGTKYAWQITTSIELILLSFALADKINTMRQEKEKAERDAIESQQEMLESLKRTDQLKDEFLAMTSHELRTPLNGMIGIAESLHDGAAGTLNHSMKTNLFMIITSGRRLNHLINDILDFSKLKNNDMNLNLKKVHLKEVVDVVATICQTFLKDKPIQLIHHIDDRLPPVLADENRLQQILYNLIGNGIKYTNEGKVEIQAIQRNDHIKVTVQDTGIGIPTENIESIFLPFQRGTNSDPQQEQGLGIGLNVTKRLVELQRGRLTVTSEEKKGSTFTFTIPTFDESLTIDEEIAASSSVKPMITDLPDTMRFNEQSNRSRDENAKTILVVDDDPVNRQVLINYLSLEGYQVETANDGHGALEMIETDQRINLVMLDIMMPRLSGYQVCQTIRKKHSLTELPVLMLTAKNQIEDRITAFEVGANDYLTKPTDKRELLSRTKTLLQLNQLGSEIKSVNEKLALMNEQLEKKVETRTKELDEKNKKLVLNNEELMRLEKERVHLLSNISHELGTPITFLQGYVQTVKEGFIEANDPKYLEIVQNKVRLLDRLIQDLFDLVKFETGNIGLKIVNVELEDWLNEVYEKFEYELKQNHLSFNTKPVKNKDKFKETILFIDLERMDQVFYNLMYNAIKHTPSGGDITVSSQVCERDPLSSPDEFDGKVVIEVRDNGEGIEENALPHIFERFYKGARSSTFKGSGTGLGLAITKEIIEYHKGNIWVESKRGKGTSFFFSLPVVFRDSIRE
ncbi:ATP-binding protein [Salipaludibacillus keqinensis]|uniref:ATP-binding protein n=1 Tax=Salipaludibacillus keqinensis TaxID=2045207 RepID=UPI001304C324|nr:ATP-binding protein [Salipaludibacillus keqinensis]